MKAIDQGAEASRNGKSRVEDAGNEKNFSKLMTEDSAEKPQRKKARSDDQDNKSQSKTEGDNGSAANQKGQAGGRQDGVDRQSQADKTGASGRQDSVTAEQSGVDPARSSHKTDDVDVSRLMSNVETVPSVGDNVSARQAIADASATYKSTAQSELGRAALSEALTGKSPAELDPKQQKAVANYLDQVASSGVQKIDGKAASSTTDANAASGRVVLQTLGEGVVGSSVPEKGGQESIVLNSKMGNDVRQTSALVGVGDVMGKQAKEAGVNVADGGVGARMALATRPDVNVRYEAGDISAAGTSGSDKPNNLKLDDAKAKELTGMAKDAFRAKAETREGRDALAYALTGAERADRTKAENKTLDDFFAKELGADGLQDIDVKTMRKTDPANIADGSKKNALPKGVDGAYYRDAAGNDTVVLARGQKADLADSVAKEEVGEVLAARAKDAGINVATGDAGSRLQLAADGVPADGSAFEDAFKERAKDTADIQVDGQTVEARTSDRFQNLIARIKVAHENALEDIADGGPSGNRNSYIQAFGQRQGYARIRELTQEIDNDVRQAGGENNFRRFDAEDRETLRDFLTDHMDAVGGALEVTRDIAKREVARRERDPLRQIATPVGVGLTAMGAVATIGAVAQGAGTFAELRTYLGAAAAGLGLTTITYPMLQDAYLNYAQGGNANRQARELGQALDDLAALRREADDVTNDADRVFDEYVDSRRDLNRATRRAAAQLPPYKDFIAEIAKKRDPDDDASAGAVPSGPTYKYTVQFEMPEYNVSDANKGLEGFYVSNGGRSWSRLAYSAEHGDIPSRKVLFDEIETRTWGKDQKTAETRDFEMEYNSRGQTQVLTIESASPHLTFMVRSGDHGVIPVTMSPDADRKPPSFSGERQQKNMSDSDRGYTKWDGNDPFSRDFWSKGGGTVNINGPGRNDVVLKLSRESV